MRRLRILDEAAEEAVEAAKWYELLGHGCPSDPAVTTDALRVLPIVTSLPQKLATVATTRLRGSIVDQQFLASRFR
jgi:hypothetical protein